MIWINDKSVDVKRFRDGTLNLNINYTHLLERSSFRTCKIYWRYEDDSELFLLNCIKRHMDEKVPTFDKELIMLYIPNARMDRVKNVHDVFTLKYFCEFINGLRFDSVKVLDPHSNISSALINNLKPYAPSAPLQLAHDLAKRDCKEDVVAFFPDGGSYKRYVDMLNMSYCFGVKRRDWLTREIIGFDIVGGEVVKDANVLVFDDVTTTGGTFLESALKLKELGAKKLYFYATHCENAIEESDLLCKHGDLVEKIYTTDSIYSGNNEKIEIVGKYYPKDTVNK